LAIHDAAFLVKTETASKMSDGSTQSICGYGNQRRCERPRRSSTARDAPQEWSQREGERRSEVE